MSQPKTDYLKQDPFISGQDYCVVSFVNPRDAVLDKQMYYVNNFMLRDINKMLTAQCVQMVKKLNVDVHKKISDVLDKLKFSLDPEEKHLSRLLEDRYRGMQVNEDEYVEECRRRYTVDNEELMDKYKIFLAEERTRMDREFDQAHDHKTSLRGFKVRGTYARLADARERAKYVRDNVEQGIHAFVVPVGVWFPVDMEADEVQDQDYMLPELNNLMSKYHEGVHARNLHYKERKAEMEESSAEGNRQNTKQRLQEQLRKKKDAKMRAELAELKSLGKTDEGSTAGAAAGPASPSVSSAGNSPSKKSKKKKSAAGSPAASPRPGAPMETDPSKMSVYERDRLVPEVSVNAPVSAPVEASGETVVNQ